MTEPAWLVDTNVLSLYIRPNAPKEYPRLVSWLSERFRTGDVAISAVTLFELRRGIKSELLKGKSKRKAARLELLLRSIVVLGLDVRNFAAWNVAADVWAEAKAREPSVVLPDADLLIFATALAHDRRLATADRHFVDRLRDLGRAQAAHLVEFD